MEMIDIFAAPALVAEASPTGGQIANQMLAGANDAVQSAVNPLGSLVQH